MFVVRRGALQWRAAARFLVRRGAAAPQPFARHVCGAIVAQRRLQSTPGGDGASNASAAQVGSTSSSGSSGAAAAAAVSPQEALDNLLEEIQAVLSRPVPIGSLFRALSPTSRRTLARNGEPLEQLLLRYPRHFALYQQGSLRNRTIYCAPPHLVPQQARRMVRETPPAAAAASGGSRDINERVLQQDPVAERQQRINTVLQYIPNEWSPFAELGIPEEVRVKCMGKPNVKAFQYFEKYPQYFELRQQGIADHTFYVRRSLALQRSTEKPP
ncbi:uncharacterized protein Tco025E_04129 [Trypanosoma conorhini]|uniref:Uncharacterized protein n=1 Tax=Trypanosoma conorhini TaxID=83891 RepID=A0A422PP34_9TRYP|nr:uncharacterized protein Tco025E_04129 [Trypanosoma conorhini]RNF19506.1 hypothetical protein Tco025E_04129 [Trypanosoma conorhini]